MGHAAIRFSLAVAGTRDHRDGRFIAIPVRPAATASVARPVPATAARRAPASRSPSETPASLSRSPSAQRPRSHASRRRSPVWREAPRSRANTSVPRRLRPRRERWTFPPGPGSSLPCRRPWADGSHDLSGASRGRIASASPTWLHPSTAACGIVPMAPRRRESGRWPGPGRIGGHGTAPPCPSVVSLPPDETLVRPAARQSPRCCDAWSDPGSGCAFASAQEFVSPTERVPCPSRTDPARRCRVSDRRTIPSPRRPPSF